MKKTFIIVGRLADSSLADGNLMESQVQVTGGVADADAFDDNSEHGGEFVVVRPFDEHYLQIFWTEGAFLAYLTHQKANGAALLFQMRHVGNERVLRRFLPEGLEDDGFASLR